ncbi:MAG: OsmC family peroxiredoxin [Chitinophagaceae bacterium]|nr:OsmC family peroxiredoxin [Chitinophagaceae bacterium]MBK8785694.1 OsmC family peroxiredoxin [Chitinophagaceae bacterium]MBL0199569.1 OsmC family peroxiredoxin [Chitinophagaceae bacterium]
MKRNATAVWNGTGKEGTGHLTTQSTTLSETQYSFNSRFAEGIGTNPEELVAAALSGCFAMKLSFVLNAAGFTAETINVNCTITLDGGALTNAHLVVNATVPEIDQAKFDECMEDVKANCLISKSLNIDKTYEVSLN